MNETVFIIYIRDEKDICVNRFSLSLSCQPGRKMELNLLVQRRHKTRPTGLPQRTDD